MTHRTGMCLCLITGMEKPQKIPGFSEETEEGICVPVLLCVQWPSQTPGAKHRGSKTALAKISGFVSTIACP